jgi:hemin uptake protein HemP
MHLMTASTHPPQRQSLALEPGLPVVSSLAVAPSMPAPSSGPMSGRRRLSSEALLCNEREVEIEHAGQLYRLRLTSLGKLILTK